MKGNRNVSRPGHFRVQGHRVEDPDATRASKQALDREAARLRRSAARKKVAAKKQRAAAAPRVDVAVPHAFEEAHDRDLAKKLARTSERRAAERRAAERRAGERRVGERRAPKRVKPAAATGAGSGPAPYLGVRTRGVIRRVTRLALTPFAFARAVIDLVRHRED